MLKYAKPPKSNRVTALKQQIKNPERVSIFVDEKYSFSLTLNELLSQKLKVGIELSVEDITRLKKLSSDGKLKFRALNWATLRPRSSRELRDYLRRVARKKPAPRPQHRQPIIKAPEPIEVSAELADSIVSDFESRGYVDDRRFAEWWVGRRTSQKKSQMVLGQELSLKGISREIQTEVLGKSDDNALNILLSKIGSRPKYMSDRDKLIRYCMSKGFRYSEVVEALADGDSEG